MTVESHLAVVVADLGHRLADHAIDIHVAVAGHFTGHDDHSGSDHRLARDSGLGVHGQHGVEHRVGNLVRDLIGVPHRHRFTGENV